MKLKFASFCSSGDALSDAILFGRKTWAIVRHFDQVSFRTHNSSLESAMKKFASFCSCWTRYISFLAGIEMFIFAENHGQMITKTISDKTPDYSLVHGFHPCKYQINVSSTNMPYQYMYNNICSYQGIF